MQEMESLHRQDMVSLTAIKECSRMEGMVDEKIKKKVKLEIKEMMMKLDGKEDVLDGLVTKLNNQELVVKTKLDEAGVESEEEELSVATQNQEKRQNMVS